jgi:predicted  nucleic acid-binding Zn-ribbon protein
MPHQCTQCRRTFADGSKEMLSGCPECGGTKFQFRPDGFDNAAEADTPQADSPPAEDSIDADMAGDTVSQKVGSAAATVRDLVGGSTGVDTTASPPGGAGDTGSDTDIDGVTTTGADDDIIVAESDPATESDAQAAARSHLVEPTEMQGQTTAEQQGGSKNHSTNAAAVSPDDHEPATGTPSTGTETEYESEDEPGAEHSDTDRSVAAAPDGERPDRPALAELREELNEQFESIRVVEPGQYELNLMELYDREEYIIALQEDGRYSIQVPETWRDGND